MSDKMSEIDLILKNMNIDENQKTNPDIVNKIKDTFPILQTYTFKTANKLRPGQVIRYVDLNLNKVSIYGIILKVNYYNSFYTDTPSVKSLFLLNRVKNITWHVDPTKVYIFLQNLTKESDLAKFAREYLNQHAESYKQKLNI